MIRAVAHAATTSSSSPAVFPFRFLPRCIPKRWFRLLLIAVIFALALASHLVLQDIRNGASRHHAPFEAPQQSHNIVHGKKVGAADSQPYPLVPFPYSPMTNTRPNEGESAAEDDNDGKNTTGSGTATIGHLSLPTPQRRPWLAAVICAASETDHRRKIRETWMHLYRDVPFDGRFVVANPGAQWAEAVARENRTYGDMVVLDHLHEDDVTANTVKTLEFYKWLLAHHAGPSRRYEFVTKLDTDLWLNARGFWDRFLVPRLELVNGTTEEGGGREQAWRATVEKTVVGELYYARKSDLAFPNGAMYTVTWDVVELLAGLQERHRVVTGEDMAVAMLLLKGGETLDFVNFRGSEKFNYDDRDTRGDGTGWAREGTHPEAVWHAVVGRAPVAVHQLKSRRLWDKVAACFDEWGIKKTPPLLSESNDYDDDSNGEENDGSRQLKRTTTSTPLSLKWLDFWSWTGLGRPFRSRFEMIPDFFWSMDEDGNWICDDIWNLGKTKEGWNSDRLNQLI